MSINTITTNLFDSYTDFKGKKEKYKKNLFKNNRGFSKR
jgi:hypothetical protein